jgi:hypothetical protein
MRMARPRIAIVPSSLMHLRLDQAGTAHLDPLVNPEASPPPVVDKVRGEPGRSRAARGLLQVADAGAEIPHVDVFLSARGSHIDRVRATARGQFPDDRGIETKGAQVGERKDWHDQVLESGADDLQWQVIGGCAWRPARSRPRRLICRPGSGP